VLAPDPDALLVVHARTIGQGQFRKVFIAVDMQAIHGEILPPEINLTHGEHAKN
jgi:hypothetical protein